MLLECTHTTARRVEDFVEKLRSVAADVTDFHVDDHLSGTPLLGLWEDGVE